MFVRASRSVHRSVARLQLGSGYRLYSTSRSNPSRFFSYVAVGAVSLYVGSLFGSTTEKNELEPTTPLSERLQSTIPLSQLSTPVYADNEQFEIALKKILKIVGEENYTTEPDVVKAHTDTFFSTHHPTDPQSQKPHVVIYPQSTEQVSQILKVANKYKVPIVANSGLTSLEGQNMHTRGPNSISLSFPQLNKVLEFHPEDLDVQVQAGIGWQELDEFLLERDDGKHLMFGPDPGMGASIAGMVSTSASGTNAYKYGTMKENVVNLTVVLADGTIVKTKQRPRKSSAGYDLTRLFIGAEGTLGIITEITVKLHVRPIYEYVTIASFDTIKDAAATAQYVIGRSGLQPNALEILNEATVSFVNSSAASTKKFIAKPTLFFKLGGATEESIAEQVAIIKKIAEANNLIKLETSTNQEDNALLWSARRHGLWSTFEYGQRVLEDKEDVQIWTTDIAVPISKLAQVISETNDDLNNSGLKDRFAVMGHIGDGNCHFLLLYNTPQHKEVEKVVDRMVERAIKYEGTCTGEHGVGIGKRKYLPMELGQTSIDMMRSIKLALDPNRILNPDKIFKIDPDDKLEEMIEIGDIHERSKPCC